MPNTEVETMHALLVENLAKPGQSILSELDAKKAHILHMAVGICGEAGELIDAVKKSAIYGKELDHPNVIEELGDLEFYMEGLRKKLGISREEVLMANINKLSKRYGSGVYTNADAVLRADKESGK